MIPISLRTNTSTPLFVQLADKLERLIVGGWIAPGESLPSVREISAEQTINPMTVSKAFGILADRGLIVAKRGLGYCVSENPDGDPSQILQPQIDHLAESAVDLRVSVEYVLLSIRDAMVHQSGRIQPSSTGSQ